jgi:pimeloyl-ACP methyl ester carboxylesterase
MIMGIGAQLVAWPAGFCAQLVDRGFFVIRYDNRDVGLSTKITGGPPPKIGEALRGDTSSASYTLADMAADAVGLLDALEIDAAHLAGMSMGGMIAQHVAMAYPTRVRSLSSLMSAPTGVTWTDAPTRDALAALFHPPPRSRDEAIEVAVAEARALGAPGFGVDEGAVRQRAACSYDRCFCPAGFARQLLAVIAAGDWRDDLAQVRLPAIVIHGADDPLVRPSWGVVTAKALESGELLLVPDMGHELPHRTWPVIADAIAANAARADVALKDPVAN